MESERERKRKAVTAIPFEMINKFYYYLSSLKVAANTLQRIMYRIPTLTCRHARFSQKANSSKPVKHWKERTTRTNDQTEEWAEERERQRRREKNCEGKTIYQFTFRTGVRMNTTPNTNSHRMKFIFICTLSALSPAHSFIVWVFAVRVCVRSSYRNLSQFV